jgi:hypothetical protein
VRVSIEEDPEPPLEATYRHHAIEFTVREFDAS